MHCIDVPSGGWQPSPIIDGQLQRLERVRFLAGSDRHVDGTARSVVTNKQGRPRRLHRWLLLFRVGRIELGPILDVLFHRSARRIHV